MHSLWGWWAIGIGVVCTENHCESYSSGGPHFEYYWSHDVVYGVNVQEHGVNNFYDFINFTSSIISYFVAGRCDWVFLTTL